MCERLKSVRDGGGKGSEYGLSHLERMDFCLHYKMGKLCVCGPHEDFELKIIKRWIYDVRLFNHDGIGFDWSTPDVFLKENQVEFYGSYIPF